MTIFNSVFNTKNLKNIEWDSLRSTVFVQDGSLRDVYMENMNQEKWHILIDYFLSKNMIGNSLINKREIDGTQS